MNIITFCVCLSFPFGFESGSLDLIVLIPDHCLLFTFHLLPEYMYIYGLRDS